MIVTLGPNENEMEQPVTFGKINVIPQVIERERGLDARISGWMEVEYDCIVLLLVIKFARLIYFKIIVIELHQVGNNPVLTTCVMGILPFRTE
jgi:hypothetical protein